MSTPAGWYDDGSGRQRWWDGAQWTERFLESSSAAPSGDGDLWSAVGKPLKGFGGGRYRLTPEYLYFEAGVVRTKAEQIRTREIFDVDMSQSLAQKARGLGTITLWVRRANGTDEKKMMEDIPGFREGVALINEVSDNARHVHLQRQNAQTVTYSGTGAAPIPAAAPATSAAPTHAGNDAAAQISKLAELHQAGILTDDEFAAAKAKALGL